MRTGARGQEMLLCRAAYPESCLLMLHQYLVYVTTNGRDRKGFGSGPALISTSVWQEHEKTEAG
jgi:hypothetical protein